MKLRSILTCTFAALAMATAAPGLAQDKITIATDGAYAPWSFQGPNRNLEGFDIDIANHLCERMKASCTIVSQDFDSLIPGLTAGKFDAIVAALGITDKRKEAIAFSSPYANTKAGFFARGDGSLGKLTDTDSVYSLTGDAARASAAIEALKGELRGKVIGVQTASSLADFVETNFKGIVDVRLYKGLPEALLDLENERIDGIFGADAALAAFTSNPKYGAYGMVGPKFVGGTINQGIAVGLRKQDQELKARFDAAVAAAAADGTIARLARKWFSIDLTPIE